MKYSATCGQRPSTTKIFIFNARTKDVPSDSKKNEFRDEGFHLFCSTYDNSVTYLSYWLKTIGQNLINKCTDV